MAKFYGIGVGPGDPKLLTLKAVETIQMLDVIISPISEKKKESIAFNIAKSYIPEGIETVELLFPMVDDKEALVSAWKNNAEIVSQLVSSGKNVGFLTLGDPCVYSTYMYLVPYVKSNGVEIETIPGITSFCAVAADQNIPIAEWEEEICIIPLKHESDSLERALDQFSNVIVMKPSHDVERLATALKTRGLESSFKLISKCTTEHSNVVDTVDALEAGSIPYLSTMIIKKNGFK